MSNSSNINSEASDFVDQVIKNKNAAAGDILEKIIKRKVEKHIRKTLRSSAGK